MSAEFIEAIIDEVNSLIVLGREYGEDVSQLGGASAGVDGGAGCSAELTPSATRSGPLWR